MSSGYAPAHEFAREYLYGGGAPNQGRGPGVGVVLSAPLRDRIVNSKFALTFSGLCPNELSHRMILDHLFQFARRSGKMLCEFAIGLELHDDPAIPGRDCHFHVYACYDKRHDVRNRKTAAIFDIRGTQGDIKHPEIVGVGDTPDDRLTWVGYVLKDDRALYKLLTLPLNRKRKVDRTMWARLTLDQATTTQQGLAIVAQFAPDLYLLHRDKIKRNLEGHLAKATPPPFPLSDFNCGPLPNLGTKFTWLHGASGCGKTTYALAQFERPLYITTLDSLALITSTNSDGAVIDEIDLQKWPIFQIKLLMSMGLQRRIKVRYVDAIIPSHYKIICTSNSAPDDLLPTQRTQDDMVAIMRRMVTFHITTNLYNNYRPMPGP